MRRWAITCITAAVVLAAAFVLYIIGRTGGDTVVVSVDGAEYTRAPLSTHEIIEVTDNDSRCINRIVINNGCVCMEYADCPDQVCVKTGTVKSGDIVCLPHRVIVSVTGNG